MTPRVRRIVIPLLVLSVAVGIGISVVTHRQSRLAAERAALELDPSAESTGRARARATQRGADAAPAAGEEPRTDRAGDRPAESPDAVATDLIEMIPPPDSDEIERWRPFAPAGTVSSIGGLAPMGSFDPERDRLRIEFSERAAGIERIVFSDYWETAGARRRAIAARRANEPFTAELAEQRYVLQQSLGLRGFTVPLLAMHSIEVEGRSIGLFGDVWSADGSNGLVTEVRDADGEPMLRVGRRFAVPAGGYDIAIGQWVENLSPSKLNVRLIHYGAPDLRLDRDRYMDIRRHHFGYVLPNPPSGRPPTVITDGQMVNRSEVIKRIGRNEFDLWPNPDSLRGDLSLSWHGTTNRYFALAVHPTAGEVDRGVRTLDSIDTIRASRGLTFDGQEAVLTEVRTRAVDLAPGERAAFDIEVYAGPLDSKVLGRVEPYASLGMSGLILYLMSECCTMCTFPWLARLLLVFLSFLHDYIFHDWALAIIGLVVVVRLLLHPLMKRSQIQMQRFGKAMAELKPEIERLQQKHKGDQQRLQAEQLKLYREKGVSPVGCIGGLIPTLLQMPIWIALYAMLYFAFELRQEPAFFGLFQFFGGWSFLGDLSASDHFFWEFEEAHQLLLWNLTGLNLLPLLMGVVFFFQQKYMTPQTSMKLSPEQEQQQKMMKIMMVVLFPLMLYSAPSGLTLYILTSSVIGIFESRHIRRHIAKIDAMPKVEGPKKKKQDMLGRMYEQALDRARDRASKKKKPQRRFKERDE